MFVIESDATIVAPLILTALLECIAEPVEANRLIDASLGPASVRDGHAGLA
jgi:deoxyhypusine synthase